jgi:small subunit ribosomal protein S20
MSKKERNRKIVKQNNRNRIINKRYVSTIKTLSKLFKFKIEKYKAIKNETSIEISSQEREKLKTESLIILKNLYSIIDKAVKKGVVHKNTAARKKSKVGKLYFKTQY